MKKALKDIINVNICESSEGIEDFFGNNKEGEPMKKTKHTKASLEKLIADVEKKNKELSAERYRLAQLCQKHESELNRRRAQVDRLIRAVVEMAEAAR